MESAGMKIYLASLYAIGEVMIHVSDRFTAMADDIEKPGGYLKGKNLIGIYLDEYRRLGTQLESVAVPVEVQVEHKNLVSSYRDFLMGVEMIHASLELVYNDATARNFDLALFRTGLEQYPLSVERTRIAVESLVSRLKDLGYI